MIHWIELENLLAGQLATANYAINKLIETNQLPSSDHNLWIHNCDTGFAGRISLNLLKVTDQCQ